MNFYLPPRSLLTLAENALTHGMKGHAGVFNLRLSVEDLGENLALRVSDNGCGIAPERLAKVGKEHVDSQAGSGTGLYLLAQTLALLPKLGRLEIKSELGAGTEVSLILPKRCAP